MSTANPDPNDLAALREALQRDAARVPAPSFDAALHHAAMRRIRALSPAEPRPFSWKWALASTAVGALGVVALLWMVTQPLRPQATGRQERVAAAPAHLPVVPPASAWAYEQAAAQGDDVFQAMLNRDARLLLPATPEPLSDLLN